MKKHSISIRGHRTSYSLETAFHDELTRIAAEDGIPLARLVARVDASRKEGTNLSSALRLLVLDRLKTEAARNTGSDKMSGN